MTLPLSAAERQRPARSCLGCRIQKHKCTGGVVTGSDTADAIADTPCQRCTRLKIECVFAGLKRIGRPRRLQPGMEAAKRTLKLGTTPATKAIASEGGIASGSDSNGLNLLNQTGITTKKVVNSNSNTVKKQKSNLQTSGMNLSDMMNNSMESFNNNLNSELIRRNMFNMDNNNNNRDIINSSNQQHQHSNSNSNHSIQEIQDELLAWSGPKSPSIPTYSFTPTSKTWIPPNSNNSTLPTKISNSPSFPPFDLLSLAQRYLIKIHPFLSIFKQSTANEIASYLANSTPILSYAISSLLDSTFQFAPPPESFGSSIADLQAGLIVIYASHGRGESVYARENVKWIASRMIKMHWHLVDNVESRLILTESDKQDVRKIFWETWSVDILLGIVTGSRNFALQGLSFEVHLTDSMDASSTLKIRAISLLLACTEPPPPPPQSFPSTRSPALTSLGSTIYILAYASYTSRPSPHLTLQDQIASRESAFMAILISSASTIYHLSSSSAFSSFMASAFPCGLDTLTPHPISKNSAIRMASNQMFDLVKMDSLPNYLPSPLDLRSRTGVVGTAAYPKYWDPTTTSIDRPATEIDLHYLNGTTHSPFYSCAVFVASQGALLTFGLDEDIVESVTHGANAGMCGGSNTNNEPEGISPTSSHSHSHSNNTSHSHSNNTSQVEKTLAEVHELFGIEIEGGRDLELCGSKRSSENHYNGNGMSELGQRIERESFSSSSGESYTSNEESPTSPQSSDTSASSINSNDSPTSHPNSSTFSNNYNKSKGYNQNAGDGLLRQTTTHQDIIEGRAWRAVEVRSQLDLADYVLEVQSKRYTGVVHIRREVKALRISKSGMNCLNDMLLTGM